MKKSLAILLTLILTFSCFSILGIGTVSAETEKIKKVILESDFNDADGTKWRSTEGSVKYGDDNGDGVNDYARVTHIAKSNYGLFSTPFNLIPDNEYELTYYIRVPSGSDDFNIGSTFYTPATVIYQTPATADGTVAQPLKVDTAEEANNYYSYKGSNWNRRSDFSATWTFDGYAPSTKTNFSDFGYKELGPVLKDTNTNLNAAFTTWTKVTANFTAKAASQDETSQSAAVAFVFQDYTGDKKLMFDIKDVKLIENPNGVSTPDTLENLDHYFGASIRKAEGDTKQALRFKFGVPNNVISEQTASGHSVVEYGTMVSIASTNLEYYTGDSAYVINDGVKTFKAESYNKETGKNIVFDYCKFNSQSMVQFTCALNNIGVNAEGVTNYAKYDAKIYVRVYIVFAKENGDTCIYYGETQSASVFAVMTEILKANSNASDVAYVKNFLDGNVAGFEDADAIKTAWIKDSTRASLYTPA